MNNTQWIFFDMGGTLIDETAAWDDRIQRTCEKHSISPDVLKAEMRLAAANNLHEYKDALEKLDIHFPEKWCSDLITPYPEALQILKVLKAHYKLGIIANQPLNTRKRITEEWKLAEYFDLMIISAEVGFSKPDPRLFNEALYKANTTADKCVMIGDKLTNDIAPAKALGFKTVWIKQEWGGLQTVTSPELEPDYTLKKLTEILTLFSQGVIF